MRSVDPFSWIPPPKEFGIHESGSRPLDGFPWGGGSLGAAYDLSWDGFDPQNLHWSTSACTLWAHLEASTIAHELGYCFGLMHNGVSNDRNFDGSDNTVDLMITHGKFYHSMHLRPSNQVRIDHHFRDLSEDEGAQSLGPPVTIGGH